MKYKIDIQDLLPVNKKGSKNNASADILFEKQDEADEYFERLSKNLLKINDWKVNAGKNPTVFFIYNKDNQKRHELVEENDLVKIKMPAPKNKLGNGFDWVIVTQLKIIEKPDLKVFLLQMKPHICPENINGGVAHFYTEDATNTFILSKRNKTIQLSVHGRNEIPNTKKVGFLNACRNFFVAGGGIFGGSKMQWQDFAEEFIKN